MASMMMSIEKLEKEVEILLYREELYRCQWSGEEWLSLGDKNANISITRRLIIERKIPLFISGIRRVEGKG